MQKGLNLYFVRHGQTYLNKYDRIQGWADSPLTESGINDAIKTGEGLKDVPFVAAYSSDLLRAVQTAKLILSENMASPDLELEETPYLREQFFGSFEGRNAIEHWDQVYAVAETMAKSDYFMKQSPIKVQMDLFNVLDPSGDAEDFNTFWHRVYAGLSEIIAKYRETDQNVLVVSHGLVIRNFVHELAPQYEIESLLDNGALTVLRYENGLFHLKEYNRTF